MAFGRNVIESRMDESETDVLLEPENKIWINTIDQFARAFRDINLGKINKFESDLFLR